jgi:hypothetical protein
VCPRGICVEPLTIILRAQSLIASNCDALGATSPVGLDQADMQIPCAHPLHIPCLSVLLPCEIPGSEENVLTLMANIEARLQAFAGAVAGETRRTNPCAAPTAGLV